METSVRPDRESPNVAHVAISDRHCRGNAEQE